MSTKFLLTSLLALFALLAGSEKVEALPQPCTGRMTNPFSDLCWSCFFPITIAGVDIPGGKDKDNFDDVPKPTCECVQLGSIPTIGIPLTIWEPSRLVEVVRTPMCSPTLGGVMLGNMYAPAGTNNNVKTKNGTSFYHLHHFNYPVLALLNLFTNVICLQTDSFDMAYMTEFDLLWDDDQMSMLINPDAVIFANPIAQLACIADTAMAAGMNFGIDALFWCAGSQGSVYPLDGNNLGHKSAIDSTLLLVHRNLFRLHRTGMASDTSIATPLCQAIPTGFLKKTMYKQQLVYPIPQTTHGFGLGVPSAIWNFGREYPYGGEDFAYILWRKRWCCMLQI